MLKFIPILLCLAVAGCASTGNVTLPPLASLDGGIGTFPPATVTLAKPKPSKATMIAPAVKPVAKADPGKCKPLDPAIVAAAKAQDTATADKLGLGLPGDKAKRIEAVLATKQKALDAAIAAHKDCAGS